MEFNLSLIGQIPEISQREVNNVQLLTRTLTEIWFKEGIGHTIT